MMRLEEFADIINAADGWERSFNDIIEENGWEDMTGTRYGICRDGDKYLEFDENGIAQIIIKTWGGRREGQGRKAKDPETKRVSITLSVSPETRTRINELRSKGVKIGKLIDEMVQKIE